MKTPLIFQTLAAGTTKASETFSHQTKTVKAMILMLLIASGSIALSQINEAHASDKLSAREVFELMQQGKIQPLLALISLHKFPGTLIDAELEREHGRLVYELEYLNDKGEVWEYELDATTGEILDQELED